MYFDKQGMTLAELLIAIMIVGFMMVGVMSTDHAIRSMNNQVSSDSTLLITLRAIAEGIRRDAMKATGDSTNPGVVILAGQDTYCFRQDNEAAPTPADYSDDSWVCYSIRNSGGGYKSDLYRCVGAAGGAAAQCNAGGTFIGQLYSTKAPPRSCFDLNPPTFLNNNHFFSRLQVIKDFTAPFDINTNPMATLDVSVYPMGQSSL